MSAAMSPTTKRGGRGLTFLDALQQRVADLDDNAVPAAEAAKFLQDMEREHPYELFEWLRVEAERFVAAEFRRELRRKERRERREAERQARMLHGPFGKFADDFERPRPKPSKGKQPQPDELFAEALE